LSNKIILPASSVEKSCPDLWIAIDFNLGLHGVCAGAYRCCCTTAVFHDKLQHPLSTVTRLAPSILNLSSFLYVQHRCLSFSPPLLLPHHCEHIKTPSSSPSTERYNFTTASARLRIHKHFSQENSEYKNQRQPSL